VINDPLELDEVTQIEPNINPLNDSSISKIEEVSGSSPINQTGDKKDKLDSTSVTNIVSSEVEFPKDLGDEKVTNINVNLDKLDIPSKSEANTYSTESNTIINTLTSFNSAVATSQSNLVNTLNDIIASSFVDSYMNVLYLDSSISNLSNSINELLSNSTNLTNNDLQNTYINKLSKSDESTKINSSYSNQLDSSSNLINLNNLDQSSQSNSNYLNRSESSNSINLNNLDQSSQSNSNYLNRSESSNSINLNNISNSIDTYANSVGDLVNLSSSLNELIANTYTNFSNASNNDTRSINLNSDTNNMSSSDIYNSSNLTNLNNSINETSAKSEINSVYGEDVSSNNVSIKNEQTSVSKDKVIFSEKIASTQKKQAANVDKIESEGKSTEKSELIKEETKSTYSKSETNNQQTVKDQEDQRVTIVSLDEVVGQLNAIKMILLDQSR